MTQWHLNGSPYEVQRVASERMKGRVGFGLWLSMGLGKSAVSLDEIVDLVHREAIDGAVVVCPNSLKSNWRAEAETWGVKIPVVAWPNTPTEWPCIFVVNYEAMLYAAYDVVLKIARKYRLAMYLDESQRIKNPQASTTKKILSLRSEMAYRRILTGTPMTQNVMDLWPQLTFIGAVNMNPYAFRNRFAVLGGYLGKQVTGTKNEDELRRVMGEHTMRATKDEWLDLPEKIFPPPRVIDMSKVQKDAYHSMAADFIVMLEKMNGDELDSVSANMVVTQLIKLQQVASGFIIDEQGKPQDLVPPEKNPRLNEVESVVNDASGKVLIFCKHRYSATKLIDRMNKYGCSYLIGGMKEDEVAHQKATFNCAGGNRVLVTQLSVGGVGHTLLGAPGQDRCSTTVFYENDFSLGNRMQAEDRNHRHGQDRAVVYVDFVSSPIDEKVIKALQKKLDVVKRLIDGGAK